MKLNFIKPTNAAIISLQRHIPNWAALDRRVAPQHRPATQAHSNGLRHSSSNGRDKLLATAPRHKLLPRSRRQRRGRVRRKMNSSVRFFRCSRARRAQSLARVLACLIHSANSDGHCMLCMHYCMIVSLLVFILGGNYRGRTSPSSKKE